MASHAIIPVDYGMALCLVAERQMLERQKLLSLLLTRLALFVSIPFVVVVVVVVARFSTSFSFFLFLLL